MDNGNILPANIWKKINKDIIYLNRKIKRFLNVESAKQDTQRKVKNVCPRKWKKEISFIRTKWAFEKSCQHREYPYQLIIVKEFGS